MDGMWNSYCWLDECSAYFAARLILRNKPVIGGWRDEQYSLLFEKISIGAVP
jgi:hypothetical protein